MRAILWFIPLLLLLLIVPASAFHSINYTDTDHILADIPPQGYVIPQINVNELTTPSNTTIVLNTWGGTCFVLFNTTGTLGGSFVTADVTIQHPNGTVSFLSKTIFAPTVAIWGTPKTDLTIQYRYTELRSVINLKFMVEPGTLSGYWETDVLDTWPFRYAASAPTYIAFSSAQVDSTDNFNAMVYYVTTEEFSSIQQGNPIDPLSDAAKAVGEAAWSTVKSLVSVIPVVGPLLGVVLDYLALVVNEVVWAINFFIIQNWLGTFVIIEFCAIAEALIYTKNKSNIQTIKRTVTNHIFLITAMVGIVMFLYHVVLDAVNAIGQLIPG